MESNPTRTKWTPSKIFEGIISCLRCFPNTHNIPNSKPFQSPGEGGNLQLVQLQQKQWIIAAGEMNLEGEQDLVTEKLTGQDFRERRRMEQSSNLGNFSTFFFFFCFADFHFKFDLRSCFGGRN